MNINIYFNYTGDQITTCNCVITHEVAKLGNVIVDHYCLIFNKC